MFRFILLTGLAVILFAGCSRNTQKVPVRHLKLSADVPGAVAYVQNKRFDLPHDFKMKPGTYLFRIEKTGYAPRWLSCRVRPDGIDAAKNDAAGTLQWEKMPAEVSVSLKVQGGSVLITGSPEAAEVVKNDQVIGTIPLILTDQAVGVHEAQLRCPNYAERRISWSIQNSRPVMVKETLLSNIGELAISSEPESARLFIDGKLYGQTPCRCSLTAGKHSVKLEKDGFLPIERFVTVPLGKKLQLQLSLSASPGGLTVSSSPSGAQVTVNGEVKGSTPLVLNDIPAGSYKVAVTLSGYDQEERTVAVAAGSMAQTDFTLNNSNGGIDLDIFPAGVSVYVNNKFYGTVKQGDGVLQTELIHIRSLAPGTYTVKVMHKRTNPEIRKVVVEKGKTARPPRIELWVPNAEVTYVSDGRTETGMIYSETEEAVRFGPCKGIITTIKRSQIKSIKKLEINE